MKPVLLDQTGIFTFEGDLANGTVTVADAPDGGWKLAVDGSAVEADSTNEFSSSYTISQAGAASLAFDTPLARTAAIAGEALLWILTILLVLRWRTIHTVAPVAVGRHAVVPGSPNGDGSGNDPAAVVAELETSGAATLLMRRLPILIVFGGLLAAGLVVDRDRPAPAEVVFGTATVPVQPIAPPPSAATTTTWFCPGMPAPADGTTAGFVTMANPTDADLPATLTVVPSEGAPAKRSMTLAAHTTTSVNVAEVAPAAWAAAQVDVVGGGAVVEQSVAKGEIRDPSACATATAPTWYVANGVTTRDATLTYLVFNPYPDDAIVDMDFATNEGRFAPQPLQGLVIRGAKRARRRRDRAGAPAHVGRGHHHRALRSGRRRTSPDLRRHRRARRATRGGWRRRARRPSGSSRTGGASRRCPSESSCTTPVPILPRSTSRCGLRSAVTTRTSRSPRCNR